MAVAWTQLASWGPFRNPGSRQNNYWRIPFGGAPHIVASAYINYVSIAADTVYGTFAHSSYGADPEGLARSRARVVESLRTDLGTKGKMDTLVLPHRQLPTGTIERVDPKRRTLVTREVNLRSIPKLTARPAHVRPASRRSRK